MPGRTYSAAERAAESSTDRDSRPVQTPAPDAERTPDFPAESLPPILAKMARGIADVTGTPLAMSAPMILATASAAIGRGLKVRSIKDFITPANLYVLVCKTSGSGGSTAFRLATAPLFGRQKAERREFETTHKPRLDALRRSLKDATGDDREHTIAELATRNSELAELEKRSAGKLLLVSDVTSEALGCFLAKHGECLAHFDPDAADALGTILGRYSDRDHTNETLWLKGYTGEPHIVFRKHSDPIHLDAPCLSALFVATPDKVQSLFSTKRLTEGGLLPRFLVCDPRARPMPISEDAASISRALRSEVSQPYEAAIFAALERYRFASNEEPEIIDATPEARQLLAQDWNRFCASANDGAESPFDARHTEALIRIALVLHAFLHAVPDQRGPGTYGAAMNGHEHPLDAQTVRLALTIRDWFNAQQRAFLAPQRVAADDAAWEKTEELLKKSPDHLGITARDLYNGHRVCRDAASAAALLSEWQAAGRIESIDRKPDGAGRPTTAYRRSKRPQK
ncbi:MAG: DUF3987 domain-containing protein [Chthoniobacteraceae bacterium]